MKPKEKMALGKPVLQTNSPQFAAYYGVRKQDLFLPRWLRNIKTGETLTLEEYMSPPISTAWKRNHYSDLGEDWANKIKEQEKELANQETEEPNADTRPN